MTEHEARQLCIINKEPITPENIQRYQTQREELEELLYDPLTFKGHPVVTEKTLG